MDVQIPISALQKKLVFNDQILIIYTNIYEINYNTSQTFWPSKLIFYEQCQAVMIEILITEKIVSQILHTIWRIKPGR
jgi:hypothetical protein